MTDYGLLAIPSATPLSTYYGDAGVQTEWNPTTMTGGLLLSDGTTACQGKPCGIFAEADISTITVGVTLDGIGCVDCCVFGYVGVRITSCAVDGTYTLDFDGGPGNAPPYTCIWTYQDTTTDVEVVSYDTLSGDGCPDGGVICCDKGIGITVSILQSGCDYYLTVVVVGGAGGVIGGPGSCSDYPTTEHCAAAVLFSGSLKICSGQMSYTVGNNEIQTCTGVSGGPTDNGEGGTATIVFSSL